jgi:hypothetical protein
MNTVETLAYTAGRGTKLAISGAKQVAGWAKDKSDAASLGKKVSVVVAKGGAKVAIGSYLFSWMGGAAAAGPAKTVEAVKTVTEHSMVTTIIDNSINIVDSIVDAL